MDRAVLELIAGVHEAFDPVILFRRVVGEPDDFQVELLRSTARFVMLCCARQGGKSTAIGCLAAHSLAYDPGLIVAVAPAERQARELARKTIAAKDALGLRAIRSTMTELEVDTGGRFVCVPSTSDTVRGFSAIKKLIVDEAAFLEGGGHNTLTALMPALAEDGTVILCSTPNGSAPTNAFYTYWHEGKDIHRIFAPATSIPRLAPKVSFARQHMPASRFKVEFELSFEGSGSPLFDYVAIREAVVEGGALWT